METKLNIAEILKDKPKGIKLYSPIFGDCEFKTIYKSTYKGGTDSIEVKVNYSEVCFDEVGKYEFNGILPHDNYNSRECLLFPSKEMRDWSKFAWKKGDVLMADVDNLCIFDKWNNNEYTEFDAVFVTPDYRSDVLKTKYWHKVIGERVIKRYISKIERNYGGKLNLTTLKIEKTQPEFKNGDIAYADYGNKQAVFIVSGKTDLSEGYNSFIALDLRGILDMGRRMSFFKKDLCKLRLATEEEDQRLFDALAKENKAWNAEKKQIVDLKPKWTPKPFDRVITRTPDTPWTANFFSHIDSDGIKNCIDDRYLMCLPYNEETAKLIGTTNNAK